MLQQLHQSPLLLMLVDAPVNDRITILGSVCVDLSGCAERATVGSAGGSLHTVLSLYDAMVRLLMA